MTVSLKLIEIAIADAVESAFDPAPELKRFGEGTFVTYDQPPCNYRLPSQ